MGTMTRESFLQSMDGWGIRISDFGFEVCDGEPSCPLPDMSYIFPCGSGWAISHINWLGQYLTAFYCSESEAFNAALDGIMEKLRINGYTNGSITESVIQTPKETVFEFLQADCNIQKLRLYPAWDYLCQDLHVLNEVKYYALNRRFVPASDAYSVQGHTAEELYHTTYLSVLGAYNYLVYLNQKPEEALENLRRGLPRK